MAVRLSDGPKSDKSPAPVSHRNSVAPKVALPVSSKRYCNRNIRTFVRSSPRRLNGFGRASGQGNLGKDGNQFVGREAKERIRRRYTAIL